MFEHWDSFFLLIGGAAGALIGLIFIVVTLLRDADSGLQLRGAAVYMTPTVAMLAMLLTLSALATTPDLTETVAGLAFGACALVCLGFTGRALFMLAAGSIKAPHWSDLWGYGVAPFGAALALAASAAAVWVAPAWVTRGLAASVIVMLLVSIRNAWDLVTWITAKGPGPVE